MQAAIALVDKAVAKLPSQESDLNFSFLAEGAAGNDDIEPPNYNNKVGLSQTANRLKMGYQLIAAAPKQLAVSPTFAYLCLTCLTL